MSQYPPGGQGFPPNVPPGMPGGAGPAGYSLPSMTTTSGTAVTSLICGIIGCIPLLSIVAIICGFLGLGATKNPSVKGRGLAITGIVLGCLWIVVEVGFYFGAHAMITGFIEHSAADRDFAKAYVLNLQAGHIDQCVQDSTTGITKDNIDSNSKRMQPWGTLADTTVIPIPMANTGRGQSYTLTGVSKFTSGQTHTFQMIVVHDSSGKIKADSFIWQN